MGLYIQCGQKGKLLLRKFRWLHVLLGILLLFASLKFLLLSNVNQTEEEALNIPEIIIDNGHKEKQEKAMNNSRDEAQRLLGKKNIKQRHEGRENVVSGNKQKIQDILTNLERDMRRIQRLTHNGEAQIHLKSSQMALQSVYMELGLKYDISKTTGKKTKEQGKLYSVCPEVYSGSTVGYPFFYRGFDMVNCTNVKPIHQVVSILLNFVLPNISQQRINTVLSGISKHYPGLTVHVALPNNFKVPDINLKVSAYDDEILDTSDSAKIWNFLVAQATTTYVLIGRDLTHFTVDARLERLIREAEYQLVDFVGGASRYTNGHWAMGCFQTIYRNYTLLYTDGYDHSLHECVYCDYISGPFLARTKKLVENQFQGDVIFEDLFMKVKYKMMTHSIVCPDSMFHIEETSSKCKNKNVWVPFAEKYGIFKLKLPCGKSYVFTCDDINNSCSKRKGIALNHCCLEDITSIIHYIMDTCEKENMICELQEGTLLGAVKLGTVLPWERDADITFHTANFSKLKSLEEEFERDGFSFASKAKTWCCVDNRLAGGTAMAYSRFWHVELYGQHLMDSEILAEEGLPPTRINLAGKWVAVPRNPGLYVRNRYGSEMYRHAQHWMASNTMSTGWDKYDTSGFSKCPNKGFQGCLDQYAPDGNLQFRQLCP